MKAKTIKAVLNKKHRDFLKSITDEKVRKLIDKNSIITGGSIASMLLQEKVNDFDYYFQDKETVLAVAKYFLGTDDRWSNVQVQELDDRVKLFISSEGVQGNIPDDEELDGALKDADMEESQEEQTENERYRVLFVSPNAISLSNGIQLITRFFGTPEEIHKNFDFVHATCYWVSGTNELVLPHRALESLLTRELVYVGSKYPVCSVIRTRKFIKRGWSINAGQYIKMCWQIGELDLSNLNTFADQLIGVDSLYFMRALEAIRKKAEENPDFKLETGYLFTVLDKIFNEGSEN